MLAFTCVIAVSTAIYTYFALKLWRATRDAADIARYTAFMNFMSHLSHETEKVRQTQPAVANFLDQFAMLMTEAGVSRFLDDIDFQDNPEIRDYFNKIEGMFRSQGVDPYSIPWFRHVLDRMKKT